MLRVGNPYDFSKLVLFIAESCWLKDIILYAKNVIVKFVFDMRHRYAHKASEILTISGNPYDFWKLCESLNSRSRIAMR
jgi:hypothetical protein